MSERAPNGPWIVQESSRGSFRIICLGSIHAAITIDPEIGATARKVALRDAATIVEALNRRDA